MQKHIVRDQMGRQISVSTLPKRIVSLVPSQTELLFDLGLEDDVVGITKFCIHPSEWFLSKAKVGGTKKLNLQKIRELQPDLIIGNKEENDQFQIQELMKEFAVWMSDITNLEEALEMIRAIGCLCNREQKAEKIASDIFNGFENINVKIHQNLRVAYFIWKDPWMLAGKNTFIDDVIKRAGLVNAVEQERYPALSASQIVDLKPDLIFLSTEPYPFKDQHLEELKEICPDAKVRLVDGELFSWYGSRLLHTSEYLKSIMA